MFVVKRIISVFALLLLFSTPVLADEMFSLKAGYLSLSPSGDVAVSAAGLKGDALDIDNELGIDSSEDYFLEAALQLGSFRLFAAYLPLGFSGDGTFSEPINFNGETFPANSQVGSAIDLDIYEAGLSWYLINVDDLPVRVQFGPEVAVKYIDADVKLQEKGLTGLSESESVAVPVPTVGARARVALADFLGVVGRVGYMEYNGSRFMDADAQVEFSPLPLVGLFAGYRYIDVNVDENDVFIDATFAGPYAGALVRF